MKKYTWKQIYDAFTKAIKEDWGVSDLLRNIAEAPFYNTIINLDVRIDITNESCRESRYFEIPVHIMVKDADIKHAICMEIATQLFKFGELEYYTDDLHPLQFSNIHIATHGIFSSEEHRYAIFHQEQECGCTWLVVTMNDLSAPFTYQKVSNRLKRSETNRIYSVYNKTK